MAGRKPPSEGNFFSTLLGKLRLGDSAEPPPVPKKGKRRRKRPPGVEAPAPYQGEIAETGDVSPFADYDGTTGLMDMGPGGFDDALRYEAAAAAGYAPPMADLDVEPTLPSFGAAAAPRPAPAELPPHLRPIPNAPSPAGGKLFSDEALDNSLDALFSGLEAGMVAPPLPPTPSGFEPGVAATPRVGGPQAPAGSDRRLFDEFGLSPPTPVGLTDGPPEEPAAAAPRPIHKPIVQAPAPAPAPPPAAPHPVPQVSQLASPSASVPAPAGKPAAQGGVDGYRMAPPTVLPLSEGVNLNGLLAGLDQVSGVAGAVLVGYDGLVIAMQLPPELDADYLGAQACNLFMGNNAQLGKMKRGELRRMLLETGSGAMLLTAADMGILVVVSHEGRAMDIAGIMGAIDKALPA